MMNTSVATEYRANPYFERERLFDEHIALVKTIAQHICVRLPPGQTLDDLIQVGLIGLLEASRIYDPSLGASFKSYATIRIRGAIMDELRRQSFVPRSVQQKSKQLSEAITTVERREGRAATDREIAQQLGCSLNEYHDTLELVSGCAVFSLDDEDNSIDPAGPDDLALNEIHEAAVKKKLTEVIAGLPDQEKLVIALYYDQELNLREIGAVLEVTESRVCQIHSQAIGRMRARMRQWIEAERHM